MRSNLKNKRRREIGHLLQNERKCLHLEQEDVARKLGERQESISRIEHGTKRIDILQLIDYAEALNYSITEIAWKIETRLSGMNLLPLPKSNVLGQKVRVNVAWCGNSFSASLGENVPGTVVVAADTFDELQKEAKDKLILLIKSMVEDGVKVPLWLVNNEYIFEYKFLDATSLLKAYSSYVPLVSISRATGINQNLLSQYANGLKTAGPKQLKRIAAAIHNIGKELMSVVVQ